MCCTRTLTHSHPNEGDAVLHSNFSGMVVVVVVKQAVVVGWDGRGWQGEKF